MKAFTDRNPRRIGIVAAGVLVAVVAAVLVLNRSFFASGYTVDARFPAAGGISAGTDVLVAGVKVGSVTSVRLVGDHVDVSMLVNQGVVLPSRTAAAVSVQTLLGQLDVTLRPISGWSRPLASGALITDTSLPTELYNVENEAGTVLAGTDAGALNSLVTELSSIAAGKRTEITQIVDGLNRFTGVVDQRRTQVSQLIDAANVLSAAVQHRDAQLASAIDNLSTVVGGLAQHSTDLGTLIVNTEQAASQVDTLVGRNTPQLTGLINHLDSVLGVLSTHQLDLAQGVSTLASAVTGFQSVGYSGPGNTPNQWANIYTNLLGTSGVYGVLGNCGALDQVLDQALGPDPLACNQRSGPLAPGAGATVPGTSPTAAAGSTGLGSVVTGGGS